MLLSETIISNKIYNDGLNDGLNGGVNHLFLLIKDKPGLNTKQLKDVIKTSQRTVERLIKELKKADKIIFKGVPKTGGYYVVNDDK